MTSNNTGHCLGHSSNNAAGIFGARKYSVWYSQCKENCGSGQTLDLRSYTVVGIPENRLGDFYCQAMVSGLSIATQCSGWSELASSSKNVRFRVKGSRSSRRCEIAFLHVTSCRLMEIYRLYRGICCLFLQDIRIFFCVNMMQHLEDSSSFRSVCWSRPAVGSPPH